MATEVEIDPSFQLKPDPKPIATEDMAKTEQLTESNETRKSSRKSLLGVFKKKKNMQYESIEDTPPTAPATPESNDDVEIDLTVKVVSAAGDPAFGFDADDTNDMMAMDVPDIFPHGEHETRPLDDKNPIIEPAQFKVPTQFEPEQEVVLHESPVKNQVDDDEHEAREILESAHQQVDLVVAHTNDLAKSDSVFCTPMNGFYEEPSTRPTLSTGIGLQNMVTYQDPALKATKQRAVITTSGRADNYTRHENDGGANHFAVDCARHENFEVVLDQTYYSVANDADGKLDGESGKINGESVDEAVLEIQRDLEGFERQMKEESREEKQLGSQRERKQETPVTSPSVETPTENSPSLKEEGNKESPMGTVEVSVEEPPEVLISVETQPAISQSKTKKEKKTRKINLGKLTKKVKAISSKASAKASSSKASMKAISSRASKVLKTVPVPVSSPSKAKQEKGPSSIPEKPIKPKAVWRAVEDPKSGKFYYYHRTTRETTWTKPQDYVMYERAMTKYERDLLAYEKYHHKPIEEVVIDTSIKAVDEMSMERDELSDQAEEKKDEEDAFNFAANNVEDLEEEPFDERHCDPKPFDEGYDDPKPLPPLASQGRVASQFSTMTEKTQRINNVSTGSQVSNKSQGSSLLDILDEDKEDQQSQLSFSNAVKRPRAPRYVSHPSSTHRTRELRVEDLGSSRVTAETFDRRGRIVKGREFTATEEHTSFSEVRPGISFEHDDAVSDLSEIDHDYTTRRENFNAARHRALVDAIDRKDGDLLKALMAGMKASGNGLQQSCPDWSQSDIDAMISENDWDGLRSYVSAARGTSVLKPMVQASTNVAPIRPDKSSADEIMSMKTDYSA